MGRKRERVLKEPDEKKIPRPPYKEIEFLMRLPAAIIRTPQGKELNEQPKVIYIRAYDSMIGYVVYLDRLWKCSRQYNSAGEYWQIEEEIENAQRIAA